MKATRSHEPAGISGLIFEEAPDTSPMIGDVLVKVAACGITHDECPGAAPGDRLSWVIQNPLSRANRGASSVTLDLPDRLALL
jgi:hypothetical protein